MMRHVLTGLCLGILTAVAQNGDKPGEAQREVVPADRIPPSPVLSPADQLRTFRLPPGFSVEVVAAEPLIHSPVAVEFTVLPLAILKIWMSRIENVPPLLSVQGMVAASQRLLRMIDWTQDTGFEARPAFVPSA